jgi:acyl-CoA thioester hydrolase
MYTIKVTPRFGDTDGLKHINNIVLAEWFELARNSLYRLFTPDLDLSYEKWKLIMVRTDFDFLGQMYYDGEVEIITYIIKIGKTSFTTGHEAWQNGHLKAKGTAVIVHYDYIDQKSQFIPKKIRKLLEEHLVLKD